MLKSKKRRVVILIVALIIIIPLLIGLIALLSIDTIVQQGFESAGPSLLGVKTSLADVDISILGGVIELAGLKVGNPKGFRADNFVTADQIKVGANLSALFRREVHVRQIVLDGPEFTFEYNTDGSNIGAIMERLKKEDSAPDEPADEEKKDGKQMRLRVDLVRVTDAKINVWVAGEHLASLSLPDVEIRNIIGPDGKGLPPREVLAGIIGSVQRPAEDLIHANPATRAAAKLINDVASTGGKVVEDGKDLITDVKKGVGGILEKTGSEFLKAKEKVVGD